MRVAIAGAGKVGRAIARELILNGHDILLIDRGQGQLSAGLAAFREHQIEPPTLLSLAKREEEIYLPGADQPPRLSRHAFALRLMQYVRDEAHRFAQHYHHILRKKATLGE